MKKATFLLAGCFLAACAGTPKGLGTVEKGMTKNEVLTRAGEPQEKQHAGIAELWVYPDSNRTVVFRSDTVYTIMTSTEARIDSIEMQLKESGKEIKEKSKELGRKIDSLGKEL